MALGLAITFGAAGAMTAGSAILAPTAVEAGILGGVKNAAKKVGSKVRSGLDKGLNKVGSTLEKGTGKVKGAAKTVGSHVKDQAKTIGKTVAKDAKAVGKVAKDLGTSTAAGLKDLGKGTAKVLAAPVRWTGRRLGIDGRFDAKGIPPGRSVDTAAARKTITTVTAKPGLGVKVAPAGKQAATRVPAVPGR
jgi:hypothetical protein